ncbi:carbohydrate ABC transporter permease [Bacillus sp. FJAT-50079]|uniref:carbohydrate ABC transporter permease n=1 Tax=Bacillus sp. FJAT-50079 TaxID=2833577 RepID=UPI001BC99540|nr:carbohydrate ABC transporter permease [Bacillus sp. FJAT-50079]MBS4206879.1 carbohydrate ABC transporter permease [Bacillus sp. FJAT-50079]
MKESMSRQIFVRFNYVFLTLLGLVMLLPFLHVFAGSFSSGNAIMQGKVTIFPVDFTLLNFKAVLNDAAIWRAFGISVFVTVVGTVINLLLTSLMAYGLAKTDLKGRSFLILLVLFTMIFQAPMIPTYLVVKELGMLNTLWSIMIPNAISAFNLIIMMSFFQRIPKDLLEAARIDGCGEYRTWWKIALPMSLPAMTTVGLFYAVGHWNGYFNSLMFIRDSSLFPLQVKLRKLLVESDAEAMMQSVELTLSSIEGIKMAAIMIATIPILMIYPFIQKYFTQGAMLGSIKE